MRGLRAETLNIIDLPKTNKSPRMPRVEVQVSSLSQLGRTALFRATLEGERRYCGNRGEELECKPIIMSDRELVMMVLNPPASFLLSIGFLSGKDDPFRKDATMSAKL